MRYLGIVAILTFMASPALGSFFDSFSYADGPLTDVDDGVVDGIDSPTGNVWGGTPSPQISVSNGTLMIDCNGTSNPWASTHVAQSGDVVTVELDVMRGLNTQGNLWYLYIQEPTGDNELAQWYGGTKRVSSRRGEDIVNNTVSLTGWDHFGVDINFAAGTASYFYQLNGGTKTYNHVTNFGAGLYTSVGPIRFNSIGKDEPGSIYFDNLSVTPEPATLSLLLLGLPLLRRRRA